MSDLIVQTKIRPPRYISNIIERRSLLDSFQTNSDKQVFLISSPAGYGKTTLAQTFLINLNLKYSWLHISEEMNSFYTFITYLTHSIGEKYPSLKTQILSFIEDTKKESNRFKDQYSIIKEISAFSINELYSLIREEFYLVLDDLHELNKPEWLNTWFEEFTKDLPQNIHIIITTRHEPDINLSLIRSKRNLFELNAENLRFSDEEITSLLKTLYSIEADTAQIKSLTENIGGWITGIHLIVQAYGNKFSKFGYIQNTLPESIYSFFANEIFTNLHEKDQNFLLLTCFLNNFDKDICDFLTSGTESSDVLSKLSKRNIFLEEVQLRSDDETKTAYNYQPLFKNFLLSKAKEHFSDEELGNALKKIYKYYFEQNELTSAIEYSLLSKDFTSSFEILKQLFDPLFDKGNFETLWRWINKFEDRFIESHPYLLAYKGILLKYTMGDLDSSLKHLEQAINLLSTSHSLQDQVKIKIWHSEILINLGKADDVINNLNRLKDSVSNDENAARLLYFLAFAMHIKSDYDEAEKNLNRALDICEELNLSEIKFDIFSVLGNINLNRGDFIKSIHYYEQLVEKSQNIYKKFIVFGNLTILYSRSAKFEKAYSYFKKAEELLHLFKTPIFEAAFLQLNFAMHFECGDYEASLEYAEKINSLANKLRNKTLSYLSYLFLAECNFYLDKSEIALDYLNLASGYADESSKTDYLAINTLKAIINYKKRADKKTEQILLDAYEYYSNTQSYFDKTIIAFQLSKIYFHEHKPGSAANYLKESLTLASDKENISFLIREIPVERNIFNFAIVKDINKTFVKHLILSYDELLNLHWISDGYRNRLSESIDKIYDIKMNAFGELRFKVRGKPIPEDKWIRKKRKLILAFLMLTHNELVTKDKIIDTFFPDTPAESLDNIFHQSVSNIRSAIKLEDEEILALKPKTRKSKSEKVKTEDSTPQYLIYQDKILRLNSDFCYKSDADDFLIFHNKAMSSEYTQEERINFSKQAIGLYAAPLLEGYYDRWCDDLRNEYQYKFIKLCENLLSFLSRENRFDEVINYSEKLLSTDKLNELSYINIIEALVKTEKINLAKETFLKMLKIFEEELGEKPNKKVMDRINQLLEL